MSGNSVKIKICGLSRPVDIDAVNEARPDYCGFIINVPKSIRNTSPDQVRSLRAGLSSEIIPVGVFRNESVETVAELLLDGTIRVAQLHGNEDEAYIQRLRTFGDFTIFKAFRVPDFQASKERSAAAVQSSKSSAPGMEESRKNPSCDVEEQRQRIIEWAHMVNESSADLVLLDNGSGGTGETFAWELAEQIRRPFMLAGGIGPENITKALNQLHPWGLDMSSSVETDGKKDREKILAAVRKVREWKTAGEMPG